MRIKRLCVSLVAFFLILLTSSSGFCKNKKLFDGYPYSLLKSGEALLSYNVDMYQTSTSGTSAGGFMANQFHIGYSDYVVGSAMFSAGPYYCSEGSILLAATKCIVNGKPDAADSLAQIKEAFESDLIDDPSNLLDDKVFIFRGGKDNWVGPGISDALYEQHKELLLEENIKYVKDEIPAGHGMVSAHYGGKCGTHAMEFINQCDYDAPGELLEHIYGKLNPPVRAKGQLIAFSQSEFIEGMQSSLASLGFIYVPTACEQGEHCRTHIVFHGCMQSYQILNDIFYSKLGYNDWAESNNIIVLYPQLRSSTAVPMNPMGCWDWWGYSDSKFYAKDAPQMKAVFGMLKRLVGEE